MKKDDIYLASNIKHLRIINNKTQDDLAKVCGKTNTAISNWEKGIREPDSVDLANIANFFNVTVDDLMLKNLQFDNAEYAELETNVVKIPVLGSIKAGIPIEAQQDIKEYIEIPKNWTRGGKSFYGLYISGDSMFPKYENKDIVIFEQTDDYQIANGKDCAVMVNGDDATFKKVFLDNEGITLQPYNTMYPAIRFNREQIENKPVRIIGIAREKRTRL